MRYLRYLGFTPIMLLPAPALALGAQISEAVGVFNIFVGLMLTVALLTYGIAFVIWLVRLGTWPTYRTEAVKIMEWSVVILFVLVVILGIVQFFQNHETAGAYVVSFLIVIAVFWIIIYLAIHSGGKKEEK
jgi:hypothetical protein